MLTLKNYGPGLNATDLKQKERFMSLIKCPECNNQVSTEADSCPGCGHPVKTSGRNTDPIVTPNYEHRSEVPKWVIPIFVLVAAVALFGVIYALQSPAEPKEQEVLLASETDRAKKQPVTTDRAVTESSTLDYPVAENEQAVTPDAKERVNLEKANLGKLLINARVSSVEGDVSAVEDEKFYLLDKELAEILDDAKLKPIDGETLVNSFGISVIYPEKFSEFNKKALSAINDHIKYDTLTDGNGEANITSVRPGEYFLFGIHKVGNRGFAVWSSPVSIRAGINELNIQPQRAVELDAASRLGRS